MLVLTRKLGEQIVVGDNIRVAVLGIKGNRVRLGLQAPPEVAILRGELDAHISAAPRTDKSTPGSEAVAYNPQG